MCVATLLRFWEHCHWKKTCVNPHVCGGVCWKKLCADSIRGNILWWTAWFMLDWKELDLRLRKEDFFLSWQNDVAGMFAYFWECFCCHGKLVETSLLKCPLLLVACSFSGFVYPLDLCYRKKAFYKQSSLFILMSPLKMLQIAAYFVSKTDPSLNKERLIRLSNCH